MIKEVGDYVSQLERRISELKESERRKEAEWKKRGYEIPLLEKLLMKYPIKVKKTFGKYEQVIQELSLLEEDLKAFNTSGFSLGISGLKESRDIEDVAREVELAKTQLKRKPKGRIRGGLMKQSKKS